jgi:peptide/nickel transport system permease protein
MEIHSAGFLPWLLDRMHHLLLPVACLVIPILVYVERIQCAAVQEVIPQTYVRAARARGLSAARIFLNYCLRPALGPLLSTIGPLLAAVLSGSLVLEVIFAWPGLGQVTLNALLRLDLPLLLGCVIGSMVLLICGNLAGDLLLLVLDPRTHITEESL